MTRNLIRIGTSLLSTLFTLPFTLINLSKSLAKKTITHPILSSIVHRTSPTPSLSFYFRAGVFLIDMWGPIKPLCFSFPPFPTFPSDVSTPPYHRWRRLWGIPELTQKHSSCSVLFPCSPSAKKFVFAINSSGTFRLVKSLLTKLIKQHTFPLIPTGVQASLYLSSFSLSCQLQPLLSGTSQFHLGPTHSPTCTLSCTRLFHTCSLASTNMTVHH